MRANKYSSFLTVILVIVIVSIIIGIGFIVYNSFVKPNIREKKDAQAIAEFDRNFEEDSNDEEDEGEEKTVDLENLINSSNNNSNSSSGGTAKKRTRYEGYVMLGYITIQKTNVKLTIIDEVTPKALDTAVGVLYPSDPKLNEVGNVVIVGHNYRNGKFFSNNKKLSVGDKIKIKDETGRELVYTIYNKFETTPQDASFYARDTGGAIEITLSTCTDDEKSRIIILARAD